MQYQVNAQGQLIAVQKVSAILGKVRTTISQEQMDRMEELEEKCYPLIEKKFSYKGATGISYELDTNKLTDAEFAEWVNLINIRDNKIGRKISREGKVID